MNATPKESDKPRREIVSSLQQELVDLDEYEQHLVKLWREVGSVSQGGMGVAPLVWDEVIKWANRFYLVDKIVMIPRKIIKTTEKIYRGKPRIETETIVEEIPIVIKQSSLEDYELEIIMQLSREYCAEYSEATDPLRPCPREIFLDEVTKEEAVENANAIQDMFMKNWGRQIDTKPEVVPNNF